MMHWPVKMRKGLRENKNKNGRWKTTSRKPLHIKCHLQLCSDWHLRNQLTKGNIFLKYFFTIFPFLNDVRFHIKFYHILSEDSWAEIPWYSFIANILEIRGLEHMDPSLPLPTATCSGEPTAQRTWHYWNDVDGLSLCVHPNEKVIGTRHDILSGSSTFTVLEQKKFKNDRSQVFLCFWRLYTMTLLSGTSLFYKLLLWYNFYKERFIHISKWFCLININGNIKSILWQTKHSMS